MREFSVLIHSAEDVPGQWIAHCLNWDLISQGDSPSHAAKSMAEVIVLAIDEDASEGLRADDRGPAPATYWDVFRRTQQDGARVAAGDVDRLAKKSRLVVAAVMYLETLTPRRRLSLDPDEDFPSAPPAFMIAALEDGSARH